MFHISWFPSSDSSSGGGAKSLARSRCYGAIMGGVVGVGSGGPLLQRQYLSRLFSVVAALVLVFTPPRTDAAARYRPQQLNALQALWADWNQSTPDVANNLAGWSSTQQFPCLGYSLSQLVRMNWRGVQCLDNLNCTADFQTCDSYLIALILNNASIVGRLPSAIGNITSLSTLELTGNPNLTGPLPPEIQWPFLKIVDLHDNGFSGVLPDMAELFTLLSLDLSGNQFVGGFVPQIGTWVDIQSIKLARNQFSGNLPSDAFFNMTYLDTLDLSENKLGGALPDFSNLKRPLSLIFSNNSFNGSLPDFTKFTSLRTLKLDYNNFTGEFPFVSFINAGVVNRTLSVLDVSGNHLTGSVTNWNSSDLISLEELYLDNTSIGGTLDVTKLIATGFIQSKAGDPTYGLRILSMMNSDITDVHYDGKLVDVVTVLRLQGSPYCSRKANDATRCFCDHYCRDTTELNTKRIITMAVAASTAAVVVIVAIVVAAVLYRAQKYKRHLYKQVTQKFEEYDVKPTIYTYNELRTATQDFHPDTKLGEGGFGAVYKGTLPSNTTVAVKKMFVKHTQGMEDFLNEVVLITGIKHKNLVNLKGCCIREKERLLVYEYVDNYDIEQVLLRGEYKTSLSWPQRHNICLGVARGLHYLHSLAQPKIIHRDIKASNILLDKSYDAKIADFGLALLFPEEKSHIMTVHVAGTQGYLAPEYASLGQLSEKVDVYSFGILVLEILSGRSNIDMSMPEELIYLIKWAWNLHGEGKQMDMVDKTMKVADYEKQEVGRVIYIALLCCQEAPEQRPTMARVVAMLQHDKMESEVLVLNSGQKALDQTTLLGLIHETDEAEMSTFTPPANLAKRGSLREDGHDVITMENVLELSEMRAR